jgi:YVTN family beta-propeller protein
MRQKILLLLLILLLPLGGCVSLDGGLAKTRSLPRPVHISGQPQLSLLLALRENIGGTAALNITDIEISDGEHWVSLLAGSSLTTTAADLLDKQLFVGRVAVPPGDYKRLRFTFADDGGRTAGNIVKEQPLTPVISLARDDSGCLFITWDAAASEAGSGLPVIVAATKPIPITAELAYISCPEIDTIYILRTDNNRISGSWGVSGRPTYIDVSKKRNELIVLAAQENKIKIIELSSGRIKDAINIPMMRRPAFMAVDSNGRYAFLLDRQSDYLSKIDLQSGLLVKRVRVIEQPSFLAMADDDTLVLSSELSQKILLINADNLQTTQSISDGAAPKGLLVNGKYLYIAEYKANNVARYNLNTGEIERQSVGLGPTRILAYNDHIYVSNDRSNTVSVLLPGQTGVARRLRVGESPAEMAVSSSRSWLYIANKSGVSVLDTTAQRLTANVDLMTDPLDIAIIQ